MVYVSLCLPCNQEVRCSLLNTDCTPFGFNMYHFLYGEVIHITYLSVLMVCDSFVHTQVCGFIHTIRGQYLAALDSYMKDVGEPLHAFVFINNMLIQWRDTESSAFKAAVISRIPELVNLSR